MSPLENKNNLSRRKFLGLVGGTALGAFIFEACGVPEQEFIIQAPVDMPEEGGQTRGHGLQAESLC